MFLYYIVWNRVCKMNNTKATTVNKKIIQGLVEFLRTTQISCSSLEFIVEQLGWDS